MTPKVYVIDLIKYIRIIRRRAMSKTKEHNSDSTTTYTIDDCGVNGTPYGVNFIQWLESVRKRTLFASGGSVGIKIRNGVPDLSFDGEGATEDSDSSPLALQELNSKVTSAAYVKALRQKAMSFGIERLSKEELYYLATRCPATGLPNRKQYDIDTLTFPHEFPVQIMAELDGLEFFNREFGTQGGDALLETFVESASRAGLKNLYHLYGSIFALRHSCRERACLNMEELKHIYALSVIKIKEEECSTPSFYHGAIFCYGVGETITEADAERYKNKLMQQYNRERCCAQHERPPWLKKINC